jgi:hypothetical protein
MRFWISWPISRVSPLTIAQGTYLNAATANGPVARGTTFGIAQPALPVHRADVICHVLYAVTSGSTAPLWSVFLAGAGGAVIGGVIAYVSSWHSTSRQLDREERAARRAVYSKWIEAVVACRTNLLFLSGGTLEERDEQTLPMLKSVALLHHQVRLYAPEPVTDKAKITVNSLTDYATCVVWEHGETETEQAEARFKNALDEFTAIARADCKSPGKVKLPKVVDQVDILNPSKSSKAPSP